MDQAARRADAAVAPGEDVSGWRIVVKEGPNRGVVLPLEAGEFRIGTGLSNDIVLADAAAAGEQALLDVGGRTAVLRPLAPGVLVAGRQVAAGKAVPVPDGAIIRAGETVMELRGPSPVRRPAQRSWRIWAVAAVPVVPLLVGGAALAGLTSPRRSDGPPSSASPAGAASSTSAPNAAAALGERLRAVGLADRVTLVPSGGAVIAEGSLPGPDLARWAEQQVWFDGRYKGGLSLVSRVREAAAEERPNLQLRAVSAGSLPYLITSTGDRFMEGAVVDGNWTIERIDPDRVLLVRDGRRVELRL